MCHPEAGNHPDLLEIEVLFEELCVLLEEAQIKLNGLFLNADSGFDSQKLRTACAQLELETNIARNVRSGGAACDEWIYFDEELYKRRTVIEHANAWLDSFKALLVRYANVETGYHFTGWPLSCYFCDESIENINPKQPQ